MTLLLAAILTTAIVASWATVVVGMSVKNQLMRRQARQLQHWQARAMRAEQPEWRQ